jgi:hypothetical protein
MSDIQDLIHKSTMKAVAIGATYERDRIIKLLEASDSVCNQWAIALIKEDAVVSEEA